MVSEDWRSEIREMYLEALLFTLKVVNIFGEMFS